MKNSPYTMKISRLTVDKLGVKLYDRVSLVIAELISNSYDADATEVTVFAPMGKTLCKKVDNTTVDNGYTIEIKDNGVGMTPEEMNNFYLIVGGERRNDPNRGDTSKKFNRKVMGRKGVGKLAPLGICNKIEIISSGGDKTHYTDKKGNSYEGYLTSHLFLERQKIMCDNSENYNPQPGPIDQTYQDTPGTTIRLTLFDNRRVPQISDFSRQLSQRFGIQSENWKIILQDNSDSLDPQALREMVVGTFDIKTMDNTKIIFPSMATSSSELPLAKNEQNESIPYIYAGFEQNGKKYPIEGWVAYSKEPYKDDLMAGVRIYCRGKIAAKTLLFEQNAGFTGEYNIRSYLVGSIKADWLDEDEDLIQTDRRDILWSHELGEAFKTWGQEIIKYIGRQTRKPIEKKNQETFMQLSKLTEKARQKYPQSSDIQENAIFIGKQLSKSMRPEEINDNEQRETVVQLSLFLAPHISLNNQLRQAAEEKTNTIQIMSSILNISKVAELTAFGKIAYDRIKVIEQLEKLKDDEDTTEDKLQDLINGAPWLINPQWAPITANQTFTTLKREFQKFYNKKTEKTINLSDFSLPQKRADFILSSQDNKIQIIEIKRPSHKFNNEEMERLDNYTRIMDEFLNAPQHEDFKKLFTDFHTTLICDEINLSGLQQSLFDMRIKHLQLTHLNWASFLLKTKQAHQDFLNEAERLIKLAENTDKKEEF